ncbi:erythromycin resistance leader peptide [Lentibacillus sp. L22]
MTHAMRLRFQTLNQ